MTLVKSLFSNINTTQQCAINAKRNSIAMNEKMQSSISSAGGNIVRGGATVMQGNIHIYSIGKTP